MTQSLMASQNRIALVIGNGGYQEAPLKNPVNDAKAMSAKLKQLGFEVILRTDSDQRSMIEAIGEFGQKLEKQGWGGSLFLCGPWYSVQRPELSDPDRCKPEAGNRTAF